MRLPNKKLVVIFVVVIVLFILVYFVKENLEKINYKTSNNKLNVVQNVLIKKIYQKDTDGEGLKDWEENLWKTDINNPDTDGDGTNDNDEIIQNRDPLKKGPNDFIQKNNSNQDENKNLTETDITSRELLLGYLSLKQSGNLTSENEKNLINTIIDKRFNNQKQTTYIVSDIKITKNEDKKILQKFSDDLINILKENSNFESDIIILKKALDNKNEKELLKIDNSIKIYNKIKNSLLKITVPEKISQNYLIILNCLENIIQNSEKIKNTFNDPINSLVGVGEYTKNEKEITDNFLKIGKYLKEKGVIIKN